MNDTSSETKTTEGTIYYVEAKTPSAMPRLIRAKSAAAVQKRLAEEQWHMPRVAKVADMARASNLGAKVEDE